MLFRLIFKIEHEGTNIYGINHKLIEKFYFSVFGTGTAVVEECPARRYGAKII
jgi:hypothetical protein